MSDILIRLMGVYGGLYGIQGYYSLKRFLWWDKYVWLFKFLKIC